MPQLLFKRQFIDSIRDGTKTTTLRRWKSARVQPGARASVRGVGWLKILSCRRVEPKELTAGDARADGFKSLKSMLQTLREIYPAQDNDGRHWYRVVFELEKGTLTPLPALKIAEKPAQPAPERKNARKRLARRIRADLDKAVRQSGSLFPL